MTPRSWLFVPGDSEKKLGKAMETGAHAIIVDLEDSVAHKAKAQARTLAVQWLKDHGAQPARPGVERWVRINPMDDPMWREDLIAVMPGAPDGIMLPKASGPDQVRLLAAELYELEQANGLPSLSTRILPLVSETPMAAMTIPAYLDAPMPRLFGITWGAEDLSAAIGATRKRDASGAWTDTFRMVRSQVVLTAHAIEIAAIDTLYADFSDPEGLKIAADEARQDGFAGMLAIHPAQVPVINAAFAPSDEELAEARAIVAAFEANPNAGTLQVAGKMVDQPHLKLARQLLAAT
ncbi:CoA ester lyase [Novosphingobium sp. ZN18A2]|uniref:HpcH/HpaI aldolase/citrate lyase family protein n=1 Tax=Novosphingobium sp. ZN18A2 TaxID=3079861 RepID=UPI0030D43212